MPTITTNGVETYYERHGDGHPIVFVHGSGWDHRQWTPQVETLADEYEVITYDVRGHGKTKTSTSNAGLTMEDLVDDLHVLIKELNLDDPVVVGLSAGGAIGHAFAVEYPDALGGLVTYEAPLTIQPPDSLPLRVVMHLFFTVQRVLGPKHLFALNKWFSRKIGGMNEQQEDVEVKGLGMSKREYVVDAMGRMETSAQKELVLSGFEPDALSEIEVPTLALTGEEPASSHEQAAERLADEIPDGRRDTIPDADHGGNITNTEGFNDALREFIETKVQVNDARQLQS